MKALISLCVLWFTVSVAQAQLLSFPLKGKFYVSVDDSVTLFLNGRQLHKAGINESSSPEVLIEPGDRVVVRLVNTGGPRRFAMAFVSSDQRTIISFRNQMCKILPDASKGDFSKEDFADLRRFADQINKKEEVRKFPFKNNAEWLWGVGTPCALGSVIQRDFFKPLQP